MNIWEFLNKNMLEVIFLVAVVGFFITIIILALTQPALAAALLGL